eukprot:423795_1
MSLINHQDFNAFKQKDKIIACDKNDNYINCQAMQRLFAALSYYSKLNIVGNTNDKELFTVFYNETYDNRFIDDYIHFNNHHSHQIESIEAELTINNKTCNISKCLFTSRHYKQMNESTKLSKTISFYKHMFDGLHFYFYHCFHVGLRIKKAEPRLVEEETKQGEYFD